MVKINRLGKSYFQNYGLISFIGDFILINLLLFVAFALRYDHISALQDKEIRVLVFFLNLIWFFMMINAKLYTYNRVERIDRILAKNLRFVIYHTIVSFSVIEILHLDAISRLVPAYFGILFLVAIFLFRLIVIKVKKSRARTGEHARLVVLVGKGETTKAIANHLQSDGAFGYEILGVFNSEREDIETDLGKIECLGGRFELFEYLKSGIVHEVYVPISELNTAEFDRLVKICERKIIRLKMLPNLNRFARKNKVGIEFYGNIPVYSFIKSPLENYWNRLLKRSFDVVFSSLVILLIFSWLFPIVMLLIKLSSKGPVFFTQIRTGLNNQPFRIYKFRTMTVNKHSDFLQATRNDPRVTKLGTFLRKTNIDELPQFFNVFLGYMSVVGPRPHMIRHTEQYSALIKEYLERHYILPGITGWAQVHGFRGETKQLTDMRKRVEYDIWYTENWTFLLDLRILFLTAKNLLKGEENAF